MTQLTHRLDRNIVIRARPDTVFGFFTDTPRWAGWWGAGSTIDARPGGRVLIRHPNGAEVSGEVLELHAPERIVFTYRQGGARTAQAEASRVTIHLHSHPQGTLLQLTHEFADASARDEHVQGWRFQLSLFANLIANAAHAGAATAVDRWFGAWSEPDTVARERTLATIVSTAIQFHDRFSCIDGDDDLRAHLAAVHRFMPGLRLERRGDVRQCQGQVLADWAAVGADGQERSRGTNLFVLDADGRVEGVTGFWSS
jgi:uncharacterized protein YndB with AHSA1/START domain